MGDNNTQVNIKDIMCIIVIVVLTVSLFGGMLNAEIKGKCALNNRISKYNPTYRLGCYLGEDLKPRKKYD